MTTEASVPVDLGFVQETLLIPLLGRARETQKRRGLLDDPRAVEIVEQLDYDFNKWEAAPSLFGACVRTRMFDGFVREFLRSHPSGTVVEIGSGLNTRFERVDNGSVRWFDLDLPDVITLRRRFFEDEDRRTMLSASILDDAWVEPVRATGGPYMFVSEAVLIYLEQDDVHRVLRRIANEFPGARLAFDTTDTRMVEGQGKHDAMRHLPSESWFRWKCDDPTELESWAPGLKLNRSLTFLDADASIINDLPLPFRLAVRYMPWLLRPRLRGYRLNVMRVDLRTSAPSERGRPS